MKRRFLHRIFLIFCTLIMIVSPVFSQPAEEMPGGGAIYPESVYLDIFAPSAILTEVRRGQVLYEKNADERLHISIANKIMTALLVSEQVKLDAPVIISKESVESDGSMMFLQPGEKYRVEDLLYAMMLRSYNDAAKALAEFVGGSIDVFVEMMNKKSEDLGLKDTFFINPTGLYAEGQYTTARDLSALVRYAITNPSFSKIFSSKTVVWNGREGKEIIFNQNTLFWEYDGVDGGKTGYNFKDKHSAVTTASKSAQRLICIILDAPEEKVFEDSKNLLRYGYENYRLDKLVSANEVITRLETGEFLIDLVSTEDVYYTHPMGDSFILSIEYNLKEDVQPPISVSQALGTADFILKDGTEIKVSLFSPVEIPSHEKSVSYLKYLEEKLSEHRDIFYLLVFLAALECIFIVINLFRLFRWIFRAIFLRKIIKKHF
jgi:D-alanyl-D-alanine carboxypeptidase (penicillin-binding protein 5/6)